MKKILCLCLLVTITILGKTQASGKYIGNSGVGTDFSIQNNDGKMIPIGTKEDPKGTPYLLDNWSNVMVYLTNGTNYTDNTFNYSLFDEQLYFIKNNNLFAVTDDIKEFILTPSGANDINQTTYRFANGYPIVNNAIEKTFYQILAKGTHYHLLKWQHKKIRETYVYGAKAEFEYLHQINYYVFDVASNKMNFIGIKASANNIKSTLSVDESIWKAYLKNQTGNSKDEKSMIDFINYLNK